MDENKNVGENNDNFPNEPKLNTNDNVQNTSETNNQFYNNSEENEEQKKESSLYWAAYIAIIIVIFIIILLLLRACNSTRTKNNNKIVETNEWITNMWNKCVDPIYWYTVDGTGVNGASINIDSVLNDCDTYYSEYKSKSNYITSLGNEYSEFKEYFAKISEQIEIIYPKIKAKKPVAEEATDYEDNMEIFYEYQLKLYNLVKEKYSEG